jgi:glycosyltransferase involved in cell wall biosynthesis
MSLLPEKYTLTVAGTGTSLAAMELRASASPAAKRIRFLGAVPKSEIGTVMRNHDLMLMTSSFEGFSRSIVEGLACGLPVVTTPGGEPNGLVETGVNGARVGGYEPELFVSAVELASQASSATTVESVSRLSALTVVPDVLTINPDPGD